MTSGYGEAYCEPALGKLFLPILRSIEENSSILMAPKPPGLSQQPIAPRESACS